MRPGEKLEDVGGFGCMAGKQPSMNRLLYVPEEERDMLSSEKKKAMFCPALLFGPWQLTEYNQVLTSRLAIQPWRNGIEMREKKEGKKVE